MKKILVSLCLCASVVQATPVLFTMQSLTGQVNNRTILVQPDRTPATPLWYGTNLAPTFDFTLQPVNGQVTTNLTPWGYTITVDGWPRGVHIVVPNDTNVWNVINLINTNQFSPLNIYTGFGSLINPFTNALATNAPGVSVAGQVIFISTNYDAPGAAQNATNNLGSAAFTSSSAFDVAGAGTTAAQIATNGLAPSAFGITVTAWTVAGVSNSVSITNTTTTIYTNTAGTNYLILSGASNNLVNGVYIYNTNASATGYWPNRPSNANPTFFQIIGPANNGSGTNYLVWDDIANSSIWQTSTNGSWPLNQDPAHMQGGYYHASGSPTNGAWVVNGFGPPVPTAAYWTSPFYTNTVTNIVTVWSLVTNTGVLNLGALSQSNSFPASTGISNTQAGVFLSSPFTNQQAVQTMPQSQATTYMTKVLNPNNNALTLYGTYLEDNGIFADFFQESFGSVENLTAYNNVFDGPHNYAAGVAIYRENAGSDYNIYGDTQPFGGERAQATVSTLFGTNGYNGVQAEYLVLSAQDNPQKDGLFCRVIKIDGYNRAKIGFTPIADHTIFVPAMGVLEIELADPSEPQLVLNASSPLNSANMVAGGATYNSSGLYVVPGTVPGIWYQWTSNSTADSGHNGGDQTSVSAFSTTPFTVRFAAPLILSGTPNANVTATVVPANQGIRNVGGSYQLTQGTNGPTGAILTGPTGYRDGGGLTNLVITGPTNATSPGNTTTIKAWANFTNTTGGIFKIPLYQ